MKRISGYAERQLKKLAESYKAIYEDEKKRRSYHVSKYGNDSRYVASRYDMVWLKKQIEMCGACGKPWSMHAHCKMPWPQVDADRNHNMAHFCCKSYNGRRWGEFFEFDQELTDWARGLLTVKFGIDFSRKT
jgi:hypothetical protein